MKLKTTLILFTVFLILLAFVFFFEFKGKGEKEVEEKLVDLSSNDVQKIIFKKGDETITFQKNKEEWLITAPLEAKADKYEVNRLADDFSQLRIERVVEEVPQEKDFEKYGIPQKEITLYYKDNGKPLKILIGIENPLGNTFFATREDETRIVLIPSSLKSLLDKNLFDFRQKDIFSFETDKVKSVKLRAKKIQWEALKKEDEWFFKRPVEALAETSKINGILSSLSNLKAKEFISEEKKKDELEKYGVIHPEYKIVLSMPLENQEVTFLLHKEKEKLFVTTSLSNKIIAAEDSVLTNLEKEAEELREKEVANFYSWKVNKLHLRKGDIDWTLAKDKEDKWHFESPLKEEADKSKIETFIRKIESLEAKEFIDPPLKLKDYGLDKSQAEIKIWVKEDEKKTKEVTVLVGSEIIEKEKKEKKAEEKKEEKEEKETKLVVVKNARFDYLFKVDSAFLKEFPKSLKDWKKEQEKEKK